MTPASETLAKQLRWWAVLLLLWPAREAIEPARFALSYVGSWTSRLAVVSGVPLPLFVGWFCLSGALITTLIIGLVVAPESRATRLAERAAGAGLAMASLGYGLLAYVGMAAGIDAPHMLDKFAVAALLLLVTSWPIGCWSNERAVQRHHYNSSFPVLDRGEAHRCDASVP